MAIITKEYQCKKCNNIFEKSTPDNVIIASIPKCPICGSEEIQTDKKEFVRGVMGKKESKPKMFKAAVVEKGKIK